MPRQYNLLDLRICIFMHIFGAMDVLWDPRKAERNLRKHGIRFSDAAAVLDDPLVLTREDPDTDEEHRYVSLGRDPVGRILVVVWTEREGDLRVISARKASHREMREYPR